MPESPTFAEIDAWLNDADAGLAEDLQARPYIDAAAVLASYAPETLRPLMAAEEDRTSGLNALLENSHPVTTANGPRWRLNDASRFEALLRLAQSGMLFEAVALNSQDLDDPIQSALTTYLTGRSPQLDTLSLDELIGTRIAASWALCLRDVDLGGLDARIERERLLEPMRVLSNRSFTGRARELKALADYVGILPPDTLSQRLGRSIDSVRRHFSPAPPLYISGPGGMGKSTLLAHFILQHADRQDPAPIVYLDFDRPSLDPARPMTVLAEAVRQLTVQFPMVRLGSSGLGLEIAAAEKSLDQDNFFSSRHFGRGDDLSRRFSELVIAIQQYSPHPVILLLDTFEQAQRQGDSQVEVFWSLMERLAYTGLPVKIVAAGRGALPEQLAHVPLPLGPLSRLEALSLLENKVAEAEIGPLSDDDAGEVIRLVGGAPLSVTLAARVLKLEGVRGLRQTRLRRRLFQKIRTEDRQGILQARIMGHLRDASPELARIIDPGLIVRRLTPEIIRFVLAGPCGLGDISELQAMELFDRLARQAGLMDPYREHGAVWHLPHVRSAMLPLLVSKLGEQAAAIHEAAVAYYQQREGPAARAEEIYHRLWLRQEPDDRWIEGLKAYLGPALEDFDDQAKLWLADRLDVEVDKEVRSRASLLDWERQTEIRARTLITAGLFDKALQTLKERQERSEASALFALEADVLMLTADFQSARFVIERGLETMSSGDRPDMVLALLQRAAALHERLGNLNQAFRFAVEGVEQAKATGDPLLLFVARVSEYRLGRLAKRLSPQSLATKRARLARFVTSRLLDRLRTVPGALEDAAAEIGSIVPELVYATLRTSGIDRYSLIEALEAEGPASGALLAALDLDPHAAGDLRELGQRRSGASSGRVGEDLVRLLLNSGNRPDLLEFAVRAISLSADATRRQSLARRAGVPGRQSLDRRTTSRLAAMVAVEMSRQSVERVAYSVLDRRVTELLTPDAGRPAALERLFNETAKQGQLGAFLELLIRQRGLSPLLRSTIDEILARL